jgi:hypothetical protein
MGAGVGLTARAAPRRFWDSSYLVGQKAMSVSPERQSRTINYGQ